MASTRSTRHKGNLSRHTPTNRKYLVLLDYDHEDSKFGEIILEEDKEGHDQEHDKLSVEDQQIEENNRRKPIVKTHFWSTVNPLRGLSEFFFIFRSNNNYVLKTNWCDFVEANKKVLKEKATIQVWSFRKDEQLCFVVVRVDEPVMNRTTLEEVSSAGGSLLIS
ncbi:hypothetical protein Tco_1208097 [Tanacetum coccineum]